MAPHLSCSQPLPGSPCPQTNISSLSYVTQATWPPLNSSASLLLVCGYKESILISPDSTQPYGFTPLYMPFPLPEMSSPMLSTTINCPENSYSSCKTQYGCPFLRARLPGSCILSFTDDISPSLCCAPLDLYMLLSLSLSHDALGCAYPLPDYA